MSGAAAKYVDKLLKKGWLYLDEGKYSVVLQHPDFPYMVRKVTNTKTDPYIHFIKWTVENPDPHLPKVLQIFDEDEYFAVDIERLEPMDETCESEIEILKYLDLSLSGYQTQRNKFVPASIEHVATKMYQKFKNQFVTDIHEGNIMYREEVPVITDPYCSR